MQNLNFNEESNSGINGLIFYLNISATKHSAIKQHEIILKEISGF